MKRGHVRDAGGGAIPQGERSAAIALDEGGVLIREFDAQVGLCLTKGRPLGFDQRTGNYRAMAVIASLLLRLDG